MQEEVKEELKHQGDFKMSEEQEGGPKEDSGSGKKRGRKPKKDTTIISLKTDTTSDIHEKVRFNIAVNKNHYLHFLISLQVKEWKDRRENFDAILKDLLNKG